MSEQIAQEPTMEEILASIRRIISEDEAPAETHAAPDLHAVEPAPEPGPEGPARWRGHLVTGFGRGGLRRGRGR